MVNYLKSTPPAKVLSHMPFIAVLILSTILFAFLSVNAPVSWNDSGMYENMLRHFLKTGKVDYLSFCLPTYIGILPITLLWTRLFGLTLPSLQALNIFHMEFCLVGVYFFALRYTKPAPAALACFFLLCFGEVILNVPTFMTDIPYISALVWFLVINRRLVEIYQIPSESPAPGRLSKVLLWSAWCGALAVSALIRSFSLVIVPLLAIYLVWAIRNNRTSDSKYARMAILLSSITAVSSLLLVKVMAVNPYPLAVATTIPQIVRGQFSQLQWKATLAFFLQAAAMATPLFLLSIHQDKLKITRSEGVIAFFALLTALFSWRISLLTDTMHGGIQMGAVHFISFLQVVAAPYVCVLFWRLIQQSSLRAGQGTLDASEFLIVGLLSAHVASTLIMGNPFLRHYIPVFLFIALLIIKHGIQFQWNRRGVIAVVFAGLFISYSTIEVWVTRTMDTHAADFADGLTTRGVPESQIDGGFSWFSRKRISPDLGLPDFGAPKLARYQIRQGTDFWKPNFFPFTVPWTAAPNSSVASYKLKRSLNVVGGSVTTYVVDTQSQATGK